ncbi:hypothetical protein C8F04DRAFT_1263803 [Mycena alexandri]|uniref:Uncharacterized protein n=1 Tax=Mycena alexandri TaxID=1745969 RepID=A0AAD6WWY2_9AGAR|nr:hypothetical protein C8F04DRAFT_1263803 [Mycena alexandri]
MTSPSPPPDDSDNELSRAMDHSSPPRPARTSHSAGPSTGGNGPPDDVEGTPQAVSLSGNVNQNLTAAMQRHSTKKHLRPEQKVDPDLFMKDPPAIREAKLFVQGLHLENLLTKIVVATPAWEPSDELIKNIYSYAAAVLLSPKLSAYKGTTPLNDVTASSGPESYGAAEIGGCAFIFVTDCNIPKNVLFAILRQYRFDLPVGIEHNPANWAKVKKAIEFAFTQLRSKFKKAIAASLKIHPKDKKPVPKPQQKNIFALTQIMVENTQCEVNVLLCARVAVMSFHSGKNFKKDSSTGFWDTVDLDLVKIRKTAGGDAAKISRAFRHVLKKDRGLHGVDNYQIDETIDPLQQDVDNIIETANVTAVTSETDVEGGEDD